MPLQHHLFTASSSRSIARYGRLLRAGSRWRNTDSNMRRNTDSNMTSRKWHSTEAQSVVHPRQPHPASEGRPSAASRTERYFAADSQSVRWTARNRGAKIRMPAYIHNIRAFCQTPMPFDTLTHRHPHSRKYAHPKYRIRNTGQARCEKHANPKFPIQDTGQARIFVDGCVQMHTSTC